MTVLNVAGSPAQLMVQSLVDMRSQFDDLQRQLATGQKSDTYAGLGLSRGLSVGLNAQLSALSGYDDSIDTAMTRVNLAQEALGSMTDLGNSVKATLVQSGGVAGAGSGQAAAQSSLQQLLGLLNTQSGDRYLFSGRATDQPPVESYDHIMNGDGARAGLLQLINERSQADLGASGLGRLVVSAPTSTSVSVAEDAAASPFGFKLSAVGSNLSNATPTGPTGSPAAVSVDFAGQPNAGEALTLKLALPDGSSETLTLTATTQSPPADNQFTIGATPAATAANLQTALTTSLGKLAGSSLKAASAIATSNDFFAADASNPPKRVAGPPFDSATALNSGTTANTVVWYTGEVASDPARNSATVRIDPTLVVSYGTRANETGIRQLVQSIATVAALPIATSDPNANSLHDALSQRLVPVLSGSNGGQSISDIESDLAGVQTSMNNMKTKHQQTSNTLTDVLQQITGVSNEEVGTEMLTLQTRMQASMQTTAMLLQTNLVNYLS
jgi:flagellin-like hook-associated protein FlgL